MAKKGSYQAKDVCILAIDDNEMNLEVMKGLLHKTKVRIDTALSGKEGLAKAREMHYDMILLDHMMPEMDGIETLWQLQQLEGEKERKIPIIALTANAVMEREEYLQKGFTDYIAKPITYRTLITVLGKYLPDKIEESSQWDGKQTRCEEYLEKQGIHVKTAMKYAGDDWEQYIHLLRLFSGGKSLDKQAALQEAYATRNWKDYVIYVHGLKNAARMIGADALADMAYEHEIKGKEGEGTFLLEAYQTLIREWEQTRERITSFLEEYQEDKENTSQVERAEKESGEEEWKELLIRARECLLDYKKKETLVLLEKICKEELNAEQRDKIAQAMAAIREYEYECAAELLKEV